MIAVPVTPTATQRSVVRHETLSNTPAFAATVAGAHDCPFHRAPPPSTAQQSCADAHVSASKLARGGVVTRCHDPHSSPSTGASRAVVVAQQVSVRSQVTARAWPDVPGIDRTRHTRPSHCSLNGRAVPNDVAASAAPTAQQSIAVAQLTPASSDPAGLGVETTRHTRPSQCSTRVLSAGVPPLRKPTAQQLALVGQVTPFKMSLPDVRGLGVATTYHACPFQCSL